MSLNADVNQRIEIMVFKKIYEENKLTEGKRKTKIMYQFKKGFDALNDAFSTIPYVKNAITEFRLKNGSDDFDSDYVIVISFDKEIVDVSNVYWRLIGAKDKLTWTPNMNYEKAAFELIDKSIEYDEVYLLNSLLYITNATPTGYEFG